MINVFMIVCPVLHLIMSILHRQKKWRNGRQATCHVVVPLIDIFQLCILVHNYLRFILYPVLEWDFLGVITSPIFILFPFLPEFSLFICMILVSVHSICAVAHAVCFKSIHPLSRYPHICKTNMESWLQHLTTLFRVSTSPALAEEKVTFL